MKHQKSPAQLGQNPAAGALVWMFCSVYAEGMGEMPVLTVLSFFQGRHVKTGQLAAIKVMDVTEVSRGTFCFISNMGKT